MSNALIIATLVGFLILGWVLFLYRRGRLKEDHAILWILVSISIILLSTWTGLLTLINQVVAASRTSDVVLSAFLAFLIIISIYYSVKISELSEQNRKIAQEIAVMKSTRQDEGVSKALEGRKEDP
jgi:hypothetical protein